MLRDRRRTLGVAAAIYAAGISTASAALYLSRNYSYEGQGISFGRAVAWQAIIYFSWLAALPALLRLVRRRPLRPARWRSVVVAHVSALLVCVLGHALLTAFATWIMRPVPLAGRPPADVALLPLFVERLPIDLLVYLVIIGALVGIAQSEELRERERSALSMEAELSRAQLHALRAQLQPHFLFNSLQAIASLIRTEPERARSMVIHLGDLLRATLQTSSSPHTSLRRELDLLQHYFAIESIRFRDRLVVHYDIAQDALDCLVPDLILQPLAENAVKHGIQPKVEGGAVEISVAIRDDRLVLRVRDTGVGLAPRLAPCATGGGLGVTNTRARVERFDDGSGTLDVRPADDGVGVIAEAVLPVVREPVAR